jgi:hypothetical protein
LLSGFDRLAAFRVDLRVGLPLELISRANVAALRFRCAFPVAPTSPAPGTWAAAMLAVISAAFFLLGRCFWFARSAALFARSALVDTR